jgi:integrase
MAMSMKGPRIPKRMRLSMIFFGRGEQSMTRKKWPPGITPRGNRWRIDTFYKGHRLRETCATLEAAESNLRKMQTLIDEDRYLEKKRVSKDTLGQFADRYSQWCADIGQKAAKSKDSHIASIKDHFGSDTLLSSITRADVEKYQAEMMNTESRRKLPFKPATVNRRMACLRHLFSKAVEWKIIPSHPCHGVKQFKEHNRRLRYLTAEECSTLLHASPSLELRRMIELALHTGMRKSEVLRLKWEHVNLRQEYLEILDQKNGDYSTIPLDKRALEILRSIPRRLDSPYVFTGKIKGQPYWDLKRQFEEAVKKSKLEGVAFHTLRHTAASHMVMSGVPLATVKEILRHKDYAMTLRYAHLSSEHTRAAMNALGAALTVKPKKKLKTA